MGEKICEDPANNKRTGNGNINAAKKVQENAAEAFWEFEKTNYELISQLDEDQHEEYIGKIIDTWNKINHKKIKIQNHILQGNPTANFHTQQ